MSYRTGAKANGVMSKRKGKRRYVPYKTGKKVCPIGQARKYVLQDTEVK